MGPVPPKSLYKSHAIWVYCPIRVYGLRCSSAHIEVQWSTFHIHKVSVVPNFAQVPNCQAQSDLQLERKFHDLSISLWQLCQQLTNLRHLSWACAKLTESSKFQFVTRITSWEPTPMALLAPLITTVTTHIHDICHNLPVYLERFPLGKPMSRARGVAGKTLFANPCTSNN